MFVTDGHYAMQDGDNRVLELFPELNADPAENCQLQPIRTIEGRLWSQHGDITWNVVQC